MIILILLFFFCVYTSVVNWILVYSHANDHKSVEIAFHVWLMYWWKVDWFMFVVDSARLIGECRAKFCF